MMLTPITSSCLSQNPFIKFRQAIEMFRFNGVDNQFIGDQHNMRVLEMFLIWTGASFWAMVAVMIIVIVGTSIRNNR